MNKKILIVDDEKPLARVLELKLNHEGFDIKSVYNGSEAIEITKKEHFDLILLDIIMPNEDGFSVLKKIRAHKGKTIIIVNSNLSQEEDLEKAKSYGADEYIVKSDTTLEEIVTKIKTYLEK